MNRIITISRQFGSGGRTVGKLAAKMLGIKCYDQEIIDKLASESGFSKEYIKEQEEESRSPVWFLNTLSNRGVNALSNQDYIWLAEQKVIESIAKEGACVIVGRCADYILRDKGYDLLTVFVHASFEFRKKRIVEVYSETDEPTEKRLLTKDKRRKAYYQYYTDMKWGDSEHYALSVDTSVIGIERSASFIAEVYSELEKA